MKTLIKLFPYVLILTGCVVVVHDSERGMEREPQSISITPFWSLQLDQDFTFPESSVPPPPTTTQPPTVVVHAGDDGSCDRYAPPVIPPTPELLRPEEMESMSYRQTEEFLVDHILTLRQYISEARELHSMAYHNYLTSC